MTLIFTTIGSAADYGTFGRWLLLFLTVVCWAAQFGSVGLVGTFDLAVSCNGDSPQGVIRAREMESVYGIVRQMESPNESDRLTKDLLHQIHGWLREL